MVHPRPCCAPRAGGVDRGASETVPSAEERRAEAAAADVLAASGAGAVAKTAIGVRLYVAVKPTRGAPIAHGGAAAGTRGGHF